MFLALSQELSQHEEWEDIASAYARGDYLYPELATDLLTPSGDRLSRWTFRSFADHIPIEIDNAFGQAAGKLPGNVGGERNP